MSWVDNPDLDPTYVKEEAAIPDKPMSEPPSPTHAMLQVSAVQEMDGGSPGDDSDGAAKAAAARADGPAVESVESIFGQ